MNNRELVKVVKGLTDKENRYIIALDNSFDKKLIAGETGKLIVIDNADILLDDDTRKYISLDDKNQYLIIGRNPKNLFTTSDNLFELVSEKIGEQTEFRLKNICRNFFFGLTVQCNNSFYKIS